MYTDNHRILVQSIINDGAVSNQRLKEITYKLFPHYDCNLIISQVNEMLNTVNMMVKSASCDLTGESCWIIISFSAATVDKNFLPFKSNFLIFLRSIFSEIIMSPIGCLSSVDALNILTKINVKMFKKDAEDFIKVLVRNRWLSTKEGWLFIGPRSAAELINYFKENYPGMVFDCDLCRQSVFYGKICHKCQKKSHFKCLRNYAKAKNNVKQCPSCNEHFDSIEDDLREHIDEYVISSDMVEQTMEVDGSMEIDEDNEPQPSTSRGKSRKRGIDSD